MSQPSRLIQRGATVDSKLLARILCHGLLLPPDLPTDYRAGHGLEEKFIQGSLFSLANRRTLNTSVWDQIADSPDAVPLVYRNGNLWIEINDGLLLCSPLEQPAAVNETFLHYGKIGDYLKFHSPSTVFATPIRECIFGAIGRPCQFCTYDMTSPKPLPPDAFVQMFLRIANGRDVRSLAIGPGTPNLRDHGVRYISTLIQSLQKHWLGTTSVELVPPHDLADLERLTQLGVGSLIMSIEIWDDDRRAKLCPGKSYVSKAHYLNAWKKAVSLLGRGKASSVLLVGLEDSKTVVEGIDAMIDAGIVPTLIPFRPYRNIALAEEVAVDPALYLELSRYNVQALGRSKLSPAMQVGCTECGGCSLEIEPLT